MFPFFILCAGPIVGLLANRHGRNPIVWALLAWIFSGLASGLPVVFLAGQTDAAEGWGLFGALLSPVAGPAAAIVIGLLAVRGPAQPPRAPRVRVLVLGLAGDGSAYRAPGGAPIECDLVLRNLAFDLEGEPTSARTVAYRSLDGVSVMEDGVTLGWRDDNGCYESVTVRPIDAAGKTSKSAASALARRIERLRPLQ